MADSAEASVRAANRLRHTVLTGLCDLLDQQVRDRPDARALVVTADRHDVSYSALSATVDDVAASLGGAGLRRADAVGLVCANTAEFVIALLGAARAGLVVAPLDPALPQAEMTARLARLGARAILVGPSAVDAAPAGQSGIPTWAVRVDISAGGTATASLETGADAVHHVRAAPVHSDNDALVLFTSGTTDRAKMVPLTHANVAASVQGICEVYDLSPGDATVAVMPLFHGHGLFAVLLATLASGGCILLPEKGRFSAHTFWGDMQAVAATWFTAVPTIHEILLERSALEYPGPQAVPLRFVRTCSAPLNVGTAHAMECTFGVPVLSAYGMTETSHQATSEPLPAHGRLKRGSVGRATGVELRVVDQQGHSCAAGTVGEVWVHGPTVARGYLGDPAATSQSFAARWFRTGDLGSLDEDGYLFLTGRIKNIINRGGEKISPEHVESVLAGCAGVTEAAVFAVPDPIYGERVGAAVVLVQAGSLRSEQILQECRNQLSPFEIPDRLEIVDALPHTAKGALDRRAVENQYAH
ncbi:MAG TPA: FadD7 family fatty acid--CoA ligase [Mycobacterium sp.]|nr:FadD7 family fatty acid--CoA ligase [Mycobacterium sp.]